MLNETERTEIEAKLKEADTVRSASIDALLIVQRHRGWVSDEALTDVADYLKIPPADLDSVATFYNLIFRRPVGKHVVSVCDSISCWVMGEPAVQKELRERLGIKPGETTSDGEFTLVPTQCLGACDRAPVIMVDSTKYDNVEPSMIAGILESHRNGSA